MPRFNRTGPEGQGPQTGRGLGKCNSDKEKSHEQGVVEERTYGLGRRRGGGLGRGKSRGQGRGQGRNNS